jgi:two-component system, LytTR family, sensor kinase
MRPIGNGGPRFDIISLLLFVMIWSLSSALSIVKEWRYTLQRVSRAEAEKARAELAFLKAQINPHFLFNTLNNIYSLAVTKNDDTPFAIMKLSNIMRYLTDDATHDYVALQNEVECISDYIELQRLRLNQKTEINFSISGQLNDKQISPLILITFVENVFKYGVSNHEPSPLTIKISADERTITLFCQNRVFNNLRKVEREGIGIGNTKQRLKLLYPNKHLLNITTDKGLYTVLLTVQL